MESTLRVGGKIDTLRKDGFIIERGPESFFDVDGEIRNLARCLQIEDQIIRNQKGNTFIAVGTELHKIPTSFLLGGSQEVTGLITSSLISVLGKLRASCDLVIGRNKEQSDESVGAFFRRRFGHEVVENLVEPLLAGTFAGDIDQLSMEAMFPQFVELEKEERSLIKGFLKRKQGFYNAAGDHTTLHYETFSNGLKTLVEKLEHALLPETIQLGMKVDSIEKDKNGKLKLFFQNSNSMEADAVILTTPFNTARHILRDVPAISESKPMSSATIATVTMAFKKTDIAKYKDAFTVFVSRNSHFAITSCTFLNRKWPNVCLDDYELLRIYIGRVGDESIVELSDDEIASTVLSDLNKMFGIHCEPLFTTIARWQKAMPQYTIGHLQSLKELNEELENSFENVFIGGSSYEGISIPQCVKQGRKLAHAVLASIQP